jgi:hypothetical protein
MAYGILPDPVTGGAVVYRDVNGQPTFPDEVQNAYSPPPTFLSSCELTALPADCDGRFEAKQANAIVSEMLSLAECWDPNGPWDCNSLNNLCTTFNVWWEDHRPRVDNISIVGAGTIADPYRVSLVDAGTFTTPGPQKIQILRSVTPNSPPATLSPGELAVEMATDPTRLWVGVPTSVDATGKKLLVPQSGVVVSDTPPANPILNQLWWESDNGILWLWYNDGNSTQWVQVSSGGTDVPDIPTEADEIVVIPGGSLSANDVQEALIELDAEKVAKNGDTMLGLLTLSGAPTADLHAATKLYVDTGVNSKISDAPSDGTTYARRNAAWVAFTGGAASGVTFAPTGNVAATNVQTAIVELDTEKLGDAPSDGNTYGRRDGVWIVTAAAGGGPIANAVDISLTPTGAIAATNVQAGMAELDTEKLAKAGGTMTGVLTLIAGTPAGANDATNKTYVDTKVAKAGDTMTGHLALPTGPAAANAVRKDYVDTALGTKADTSYVNSQDALKLNLTGGTMTGALTITGNVGAVITGNVTTYGWGGDNAKGIVFLNAAQSRYLHFDGTNYSMPGAHVYSAAGRLWGNSDFNFIPANPAGQAFSGSISAPMFTGNVSAGSITVTGGGMYLYGWAGDNNKSVLYMNSAGNWHIYCDGSAFHMVTPGTMNVTGNITSTGNITAAGRLMGAEVNSGVRLHTSSGNKLTFNFVNPNLQMYIDDNFIKNFVINHPVDSRRYLVHGCLEGPEAGVYYRGKGRLTGSSVEIELPSYFTALVDEDSATVQITPIMTAQGATPLAASEVLNGRFTVARAGSPSEHEQPFHWRVEATRKDVDSLLVEPLKDEIEVHGDGPYRYYSEKTR